MKLQLICSMIKISFSNTNQYVNKYIKEPKQNEKRVVEASAEVPHDVLVMAFKMCDRNHTDYYTFDVLSDMLGHSESSFLYNKL